jgi:hypothetical protein
MPKLILTATTKKLFETKKENVAQGKLPNQKQTNAVAEPVINKVEVQQKTDVVIEKQVENIPQEIPEKSNLFQEQYIQKQLVKDSSKTYVQTEIAPLYDTMSPKYLIAFNDQKQPRLFKAINKLNSFAQQIKHTKDVITNTEVSVMLANVNILNLN